MQALIVSLLQEDASAPHMQKAQGEASNSYNQVRVRDILKDPQHHTSCFKPITHFFVDPERRSPHLATRISR